MSYQEQRNYRITIETQRLSDDLLPVNDETSHFTLVSR